MLAATRTLFVLTLIGVALLAGPVSAQGLLIPTDKSVPALALKHHRVTIDARDGTAVTTIEQVYKNSTSRMLEATYLFPVPDDAVVMDFRLMVNGKMKKGEVLEKGRANAIYTRIVRSMRDPGIVDWLGKSLFRARIFPVPANGEQKVTITYTQVLPFLDGTYKLSYPLKTSAVAAKTLEDFTLTATIEHQTPLRAVYSPSHKVSIRKKGDHKAIVGFEGEALTLDKDFTLYFGVSKKDIGLTLLTHKPDPKKPGFFMLMAAPKAIFDTDEIQGKAITFVLDTSGSMTGVKMDQAKKALKWSLDHLGSDDQFNVIRFSSDVESFKPTLVAASKSAIGEAKRFVDDFEAAGGTAINDALAQALAADTHGQPHLILFMTDGRPTVGATDEGKILAHVNAKAAKQSGSARIFALGIGDDINTHLLDKLADAHGGTSAYVKPTEDMDTHIAALYNQIAYPVLTGITLDIDKIRTYAASPSALPDIFRGGQLMVVGRYRAHGDSLIQLKGQLGKETRTFDFEGTFSGGTKNNAFIASVWAHRQVGLLLDQIRLNGETQPLKDEVIQLATKYGIVTPYTSYLVVEDGTDMSGGRPPIIRPPPRPRPHWRRTPSPEPAAEERKGASFAPKAPSRTRADRESDVLDAATARPTSAAGGSGSAKSGKRAVSTAKVLREYKNKDKDDSEVTSVRYVQGRVFSYRGARGWVDNAVKSSLKTLKIAPYSLAWMQLAALSDSIKEALTLGDSVTLKVGGYAIQITAGGKTDLDAKTLKALQKAAK